MKPTSQGVSRTTVVFAYLKPMLYYHPHLERKLESNSGDIGVKIVPTYQQHESIIM